MNQCMQRKSEAEHFQFNASVNYIFSEQPEYTKVGVRPLWSSLHNKSGVYIGEGGAIMLATMSSYSDTPILALATLGSMTKIETILSVSHRPRWPRKVNTLVTVAGIFTNKCCQCKRPINHNFSNSKKLKSLNLCPFFPIRKSCWVMSFFSFFIQQKITIRHMLLSNDKKGVILSYKTTPWGLYYKTFYGRNLQIFVTSQKVSPWKAFPA